MRFQRIIQETYFRPWLITEAGWYAVDRIVQAHVLQKEAASRGEDIFGDALPTMTIADGIATIPVHGTIMRRAGMIAKSCGAVDTEDVSKDIAEALADNSVRGIVLDVDSPGGTVSGVPELGDQIARASEQKPVWAYTGDTMASAAYWISAGAERVIASPSATVGSIGVFIPWIDQSKAYEARGLNVSLIKSGTYKGMGYPGTSLSDEQREYLQASVNETHDEFRAFVSSYRKTAKRDAMEGQTFTGKGAVAQGLVTGLADSLGEVEDRMRRALTRRR